LVHEIGATKWDNFVLVLYKMHSNNGNNYEISVIIVILVCWLLIVTITMHLSTVVDPCILHGQLSSSFPEQ
jgi:hypothetical protein